MAAAIRRLWVFSRPLLRAKGSAVAASSRFFCEADSGCVRSRMHRSILAAVLDGSRAPARCAPAAPRLAAVPAALHRPHAWRWTDHSPITRQQAWRLQRRLRSGVPTAGAATEAEPAMAPAPAADPQATHFKALRIKDFALVVDQRVQLQPGLTVITGESGSGKSVLVEAFGQILGAGASDESIRPPASAAELEAEVTVAPGEQPALRRLLAELGVPQRAARELGVLMLRRELVKGPDGSVRSRCFINGSATSVRVLREVGQLLVDVNGQHAALTLKDGATRLRLLDRLAGTSAAADAFAASLAEWQQAHAQLRELDALSDEREREAMQRLVDDVHAAGVEPGEDRALRWQLRQLDARRVAAERCRLVSVGLSGGSSGGDGGGIADAMREVQLQVKQLLSQEERLAAQAAAEREEEEAAGGPAAGGAWPGQQQRRQPRGGVGGEHGDDDDDDDEAGGSAAGMLLAAVDLLEQAQALLDGAEEHVVQYAKLYRFSQAEYDELSARLQQLERLMKQHDASSVEELLETAQRQEVALDAYFQLEGQRDFIEAEAARLLSRVQQQAVALSQQRQAAAGRLSQGVEAVLADLAMAGSRFDVQISWMPLSAAASAATAGGGAGGSSGATLAVGTAQARACGQEGGRYRVRPAGLDTVDFLFAAGPGEPLRPLSAVASGGESARLMLALKAAPAFMPAGASMPAGEPGPGQGCDGAGEGEQSLDSAASGLSGSSSSSSSSNSIQAAVDAAAGGAGGGGGGASGGSQILILDEIDSGIGARLGQPIGRILRRMAGAVAGPRVGQILCVSHLPQVAAHAESHLCVRKAVAEDDRVVTQFELLSRRSQRLQELSAMAGAGLPEAAAEELLQAAAQAEAQA